VNLNILRLSTVFLYLYGNTCFSQAILTNVKYQLESGVYLSNSNQTPFWLRSNQYGIVPLESQFITMRGSAHKEYDSTKNIQGLQKRFSYGYGINTVINIGKANQILLPEAYIKIRYGALELYGGRRKEIFGLTDTLLSSGSYIWSGNSLPVPKLQISIPNYTSIFGQDLFAIKGGYAHGWFGSQGDVKNYYLHQKWLYGKIGKPHWKIKFYGGFNHQVQWGGYPIKPYIETATGKLIDNFGNDFKTYIKVVTGVSLNANEKGADLTGVPLNEAWNRAGNHLGSVDIGTEVNLRSYDLFFYRQSVYEDGSLFYLNNITDGLIGISIKRKDKKEGITKVSFEHLNTTSQGGPTGSGNTIPQLRGGDNYFNNGTYNNGWNYNGFNMGTPLITPLNKTKNSLIDKNLFTNVPNSYIVNNRVQGYSLSFIGKFQKIDFYTKLLWTHNLGIYGAPFLAKQFSFLQQTSYQLPNYTFITSLAIDRGKLHLNNLGCYIGIRRTFF
jgi:hypothetical protein